MVSPSNLTQRYLMNRFAPTRRGTTLGLGLLTLAWVAWSYFGASQETRTVTRKIQKSDAEWKALLTPEQYQVCRRKGTERAFTGTYHDCKTPGTYRCVACGEPLFESEAKYDSGSGWPSFVAPIAPGAVDEETDSSLFMTRTEVLCNTCGSHLGHVFPDGPRPTGLRYCINSAALSLDAKPPTESRSE